MNQALSLGHLKFFDYRLLPVAFDDIESAPGPFRTDTIGKSVLRRLRRSNQVLYCHTSEQPPLYAALPASGHGHIFNGLYVEA